MLSVGGARRSLAAALGGSGAAGGGGAPAASSERRATAVVAAQASEDVCGAGGCAAAALGGAKGAAATHSLTASAGARRLPRRLQSVGFVSKVSVSSLRAASHGALTPKRARCQSRSSSLFALGQNHRTRRTPLTAHASTQQSWGPTGSCTLITRRKTHFGAARCTSPSEHSSEPPTTAVTTTLVKHNTTYKAS